MDLESHQEENNEESDIEEEFKESSPEPNRKDEEKSPMKEWDESPVKDEEESPVKDEEESPVKDEEESPVKDEEESPVKDEEESPVKEEGPDLKEGKTGDVRKNPGLEKSPDRTRKQENTESPPIRKPVFRNRVTNPQVSVAKKQAQLESNLTGKSLQKFERKLSYFEKQMMTRLGPDSKHIHIILQLEQTFQHIGRIRNLHKRRALFDGFQKIKEYPFIWELRRSALQRLLLKKIYKNTKRQLCGIISWRKFVIWQATAELHLRKMSMLLKGKITNLLQYSIDKLRVRDNSQKDWENNEEGQEEAIEGNPEETSLERAERENKEAVFKSKAASLYHLLALLQLQSNKTLTGAWVDIKIYGITKIIIRKHLGRVVSIAELVQKTRSFGKTKKQAKMNKTLQRLSKIWFNAFNRWKRPVTNALKAHAEDQRKQEEKVKGSMKMLVLVLNTMVKSKKLQGFHGIRHGGETKEKMKLIEKSMMERHKNYTVFGTVLQKLATRISLQKMSALSDIFRAGKRHPRNYRLLIEPLLVFTRNRKKDAMQALALHFHRKGRQDRGKINNNFLSTISRKANSKNLRLKQEAFDAIRDFVDDLERAKMERMAAASQLLNSSSKAVKQRNEDILKEAINEMKIYSINSKHEEEAKEIQISYEKQKRLVAVATILNQLLPEKINEIKHMAFAATYMHISNPEAELPAVPLKRDPIDVSDATRRTQLGLGGPPKKLESALNAPVIPQGFSTTLKRPTEESLFGSKYKNRHVQKCDKEHYVQAKIDEGRIKGQNQYFSPPKSTDALEKTLKTMKIGQNEKRMHESGNSGISTPLKERNAAKTSQGNKASQAKSSISIVSEITQKNRTSSKDKCKINNFPNG